MEPPRTTSFPYLFKYLHHDRFKDFTHVCNLSSIRPGRTTGDPTVTDLRCIRYTPDQQFHLSSITPMNLIRNKGTTTAVFHLSENDKGEISAPPVSESRDPSGLSSSLWQFVNLN